MEFHSHEKAIAELVKTLNQTTSGSRLITDLAFRKGQSSGTVFQAATLMTIFTMGWPSFAIGAWAS